MSPHMLVTVVPINLGDPTCRRCPLRARVARFRKNDESKTMSNQQQADAPPQLAEGAMNLALADLQPGDVLLYCPKAPNVVQRGISARTTSPYTHALIYLGNEIIAEALTRGGVQKRPLNSALAGAAHVGVLRTQMGFSAQRTTLLNEFINLVIDHGRWYDFNGALTWPHTNRDSLVSQMDNIVRHYGEFKTNEEIAKSAFFCSSLVVACFTAVGIIDASAQVAYPPAAVAPGGLYVDPTFGWLLGFLVPKGSSVPTTDPLLSITRWSDIAD